MQNIRRLALGAALVFLPVLLTACSTTPRPVEYRATPVYVPRPVAIKPEFTNVPAEPKAPGRACRDDDGAPTICNDELGEWSAALRAWGRGLAGQLRRIAELQPKEQK